ncbi:MAG: type II toxin-antitoxin system HicB family antitoxin [Methanoregula sp.]|nr:type II toxin-antitoxin system HicB family antitoxin [Methanoregula sp.]
MPGCFSQGETVEETIGNTKEAIELYIQALKEDNAEIPAEDDLIISHVRIKSAAV